MSPYLRLVALSVLALATLPAAGPPPARPTTRPSPVDSRPAVDGMTAPQLLAEYRGTVERTRPVSERRIQVYNAMRRSAPEVIAAIRPELESPEGRVRTHALLVLKILGNKARPLVPELIKIADDDQDGATRATAIDILCHLRDPRALETLVRAAADPAPSVRTSLLLFGQAALADLPFVVAVNALKDAESQVRVGAIRQLSALKDKRAVAYLAPLLGDDTVLHRNSRNNIVTVHRISDAVVEALEMIVDGKYLLPGDKTQADYDALVQKWQTWWKESGETFDAAVYHEPDLVRATR